MKLFVPIKNKVCSIVMEAYTILIESNAKEDITHFVEHFKLLFDPRNSILTDMSSSKFILDNYEFLMELNLRSNRLLKALVQKTPYPTLLSDLVIFQKQVQVIYSYYADQCKKGQPIATANIKEMLEQNSKLSKICAEIKLGMKDELTKSDSEQIKQYISYSCAQSIMQEDMAKLVLFVTRPYMLSTNRSFSN